jgi:hypothetical protein
MRFYRCLGLLDRHVQLIRSAGWDLPTDTTGHIAIGCRRFALWPFLLPLCDAALVTPHSYDPYQHGAPPSKQVPTSAHGGRQ